jgi:micrococcal nuclease
MAPKPVVEAGVVRYISEGDTYHITVSHRDLNVRLLGVDTPSTKRLCAANTSDCVAGTMPQCGGPQAAQFAQHVLAGRAITLVPDPTGPNLDRYGRALRYIRVPGVGDYSIAVVRAGWARVQPNPGREGRDLELAQAEAVSAKRGIWGRCPHPSPGD